jgi:flavin prenyltransferase
VVEQESGLGDERRLIVAMTGASGAIYGVRFLEQAARHFDRVYLIVSEQAAQVAAHELGRPVAPDRVTVEALVGRDLGNVTLVDRRDYFTPPASGSFRHEGMVIVPCSMGTAGRIANGISDDLTTRAADVCLKERRRLVLVVRETPFNLVHLRNLTQLAEAGATVLPASPGFYHRPRSIDELVDTIVARALQQLGVEQRIVPEWQAPQSA